MDSRSHDRLLHPLELRIAVREHTRPASYPVTSQSGSVRKEEEHVLSVRSSTWQPLFALDLLPTENHARAGTVPVDGSDLAVVPLREQRRAVLVA
jgi:hypothetical protein